MGSGASVIGVGGIGIGTVLEGSVGPGEYGATFRLSACW